MVICNAYAVICCCFSGVHETMVLICLLLRQYLCNV